MPCAKTQPLSALIIPRLKRKMLFSPHSAPGERSRTANMESPNTQPHESGNTANRKRSSKKRPPRPRAEVLLNPRIETRREEARRRAGWTEELDKTPRPSISYFLKDITPDECIEALLCDDSPEALKFNALYNSLAPSDRGYLALEELAVLAGVNPRELVQTITGALYSQTHERQKAIVLRNQPKIVQKTIKLALTNRGVKDRDMFHRATGFLPMAKGAQTTINLNQQNNTNNEAPAQPALSMPRVLQGITAESTGPLTVGSTDDFLLDMQNVVRPQLKAPIEPVNSEVPVNAPELAVIEADV